MSTRYAAWAIAGIIACAAAPASAQATYVFNLPAQSLESSLKAIGKQTRTNVIFSPDSVRGRSAAILRGNYSVRSALEAVTRDTGLTVTSTAGGSFLIAHAENASNAEASEVVVTGSHIRGATPTSPVLKITNRDIRDAGQNDLGQVFRSIPQNFNGGLNPGLAPFVGATNSDNGNLTGGSAVDLRGLGQGATLTLLNGRRLAYEGPAQGIDVSAIPVDAVDRIEVTADGASALYGSDAVAGVANIILKRDYDGVTVSGRLGTATEGGDFEQQYGIVAGQRWNGGGYIATFNYAHNSAVFSDQRSYTRYVNTPYALISPVENVDGLVSFHQDLAEGLTLSLDALGNHLSAFNEDRTSATVTARVYDRTKSYNLAPSLQYLLANGWKLEAFGTFGWDQARTDTGTYSNTDIATSRSVSCYCNKLEGGELNAEGGVLQLPGGEARLAMGAGYRRTIFNQVREYTLVAPAPSIFSTMNSYYAYGEVLVPVVSPSQAISLLNRLQFSAAARFEHYDNFGGVVTPKLGLVYSPSPSLDFKGSWSRSFKAPTQLQEASLVQTALIPAAVIGASGVPSGSTALIVIGGNSGLKPERATTRVATLDFHPAAAPTLNLEVSWFDVHYQNRVALPVAVLSAAYTNPAYRAFVAFAPSATAQSAAIAMSPVALSNQTGAVYDPLHVVALVDDRYTNTAAQKIHGIDLDGRYAFTFQGTVTVSGQASWLHGTQRTTAASPPFDIAGAIFYPPHWRGRAGMNWTAAKLTVATFYNYIGPIRNTQVSPATEGKAMGTVDLMLSYRPGGDAGPMKGLSFSVSAINLADKHPPLFQNTNVARVDYDSTNYSPIGRFLSVSVRKDF